MRCIVREYIAAAIDRGRPDLERYIAGHLQCPQAVPLAFTDPVASIREIRGVKIAPRFRADFPPVDVVVTMRVSLTARTRQRGVDLGTTRIAVDVELDAIGTTAGQGYDLKPQRARLLAWWGG